MQDYNTGTGVEDDRRSQAGEAVRNRAEQATERARAVGQTVRDQVGSQVDRGSTAAGEQAVAASGAIRQAGTELRSQGNDLPAQLIDRAAEQLERAGRYLRERDGDTILRDVEDFARRQPWVVAGIALAAGLAGARLLKASRDGDRRMPSSGER